MVKIEIAYMSSDIQTLMALSVPENTTVEAAIKQSNLLQQFPEIDLQKNTVGVFGDKVTLQYLLKEGDRIEIYRQLKIDPKEARRMRANKK